MKVKEVMSRTVHMVKADDKVEEAAKVMASNGVGFLPVADGDRLIGSITDRDIVLRCLAQGKDGAAKVRDAMTHDVKYCFEDEDLDRVVGNMSEQQVRRLPVMNREKRLIGIVSLADAARRYASERVGEALSGIVAPGGRHSGGRARP